MKRAIRIAFAWMTVLAAVVVPFAGASSAEVPVPVELRGFSAHIGPQGEPWAVWSADNGHDTELYYSRWTGREWSPARALYTEPTTWDDYPSLAFAADGTPWVAWSSADQEQSNLYISRWVGSSWSTPEEVPTGSVTWSQQATLAAAPDGGFWLAWIGFDGNDDEVYVNHWDGLSWSQPEQVGQDDADPMAYDTQPDLAVDDEGFPWLLWVSRQALFDDAVVASRWDGREWSPEQMVSAPDGTPDNQPSLALDATGQPWVAWQDVVGTGADSYRRIYVARWQADRAAWTQEELVSSSNELPLDEEYPHLSFDGEGQPHLVWSVVGELSGIAYATWNGTAWTQAAWAAEQVAADAPILLPAKTPWLLWADVASISRMPLGSQWLNGTLSPLPETLSEPQSIVPQTDVVLYRSVAWGDSITLGDYDDPMDSGVPVGPYPGRLEEKFDTRVVASEVINLGISGETTLRLGKRIGEEAGLYRPQFPLIMEGTNDVTHEIPPNGVVTNFLIMVDVIRKYVGLKEARIWFGTVIPRMDNYNKATSVLNDHIREMVANKGFFLADNWQAYYDYGKWQELMRDSKHPNNKGMQLLADTFYTRMVATHSGLREETIPPQTWIKPLPAESLCGEVPVEWEGTDNLSWVVDYDVQLQENGGAWTDWLMATESSSATYTNENFGTIVAFRVRGRDVVGNQNDYSAAISTRISDDGPPEDAQITALPPAQKPPFEVSWSATDLCGEIAAYDVQYSVGTPGNWKNWQQATPKASASFNPTPAEYGKAYYFQVRARDEAGNWSDWSNPGSTLLARYTLSGQVFNTRHEPVLKPQATIAGGLGTESLSTSYVAYVGEEGNYDLTVTHDKFGALPPMRSISVTTDIAGLDFFLPPQDDVIIDGGFEAGVWGQWQPSGTFTMTLDAGSHTGDGAALLGGVGMYSKLSQAFTMPGDLANGTLSFLARPDDSADGSSTIQVELEGTPISHTQVVSADGWTHIWLPVDGVPAGEEVTLSFTVSNTAEIRLDEVTLGSAVKGGYWGYMPLVKQALAP